LPTLLAAHLHFSNAKAKQKMQKSCQSNAWTGLNSTGQHIDEKRRAACNSGLAKVAVQCFVGQFFV